MLGCLEGLPKTFSRKKWRSRDRWDLGPVEIEHHLQLGSHMSGNDGLGPLLSMAGGFLVACGLIHLSDSCVWKEVRTTGNLA